MPRRLHPYGHTTPLQLLIQLSEAVPGALLPSGLLHHLIFQQDHSFQLCKMSQTQPLQILRELSLKVKGLVGHAPLLTRDLQVDLGGNKVVFPNRTPK